MQTFDTSFLHTPSEFFLQKLVTHFFPSKDILPLVQTLHLVVLPDVGS